VLIHCLVEGYPIKTRLSLAVQCFVIGPVCGCAYLWQAVFVGGSVAAITHEIVCIDLHQTGFVGKGLYFSIFWPSCTPGKGVCRRVHRVLARDYKNIVSASGVAPSFSQEAVVRRSFQGVDSAAQETLLAVCALPEILDNMPTYDTLVVVAGEPCIPDRQLEDAENAAAIFAFPDSPDGGCALPTSSSLTVTHGRL